MKKLCGTLLGLAIITTLFTACGKPEKATTLKSAIVEASEFCSYAITQDGSLWYWGTTVGHMKYDGQPPAIEDCLTPQPQKLMNNVKSVSTGETFALILKNDGSLWGWGTYPDVTTIYDTPQKLMDGVCQISAEGRYLLVIDENNVLWDWGTAERVAVRTAGSNVFELVRPVQLMENVVFVSASDGYFLAIRTDGSLWGQGFNINGQLGDSAANYTEKPVQLMKSVSFAAAGPNISLAITDDSRLFAWGNNANGLISQNGDKIITEPMEIARGVTFATVELLQAQINSQDTIMYITEDSSLWVMGYNILTGTFETEATKIMDDIIQVSICNNHMLIANKNDQFFGLGSNELAGLASDQLFYSDEPVLIPIERRKS